MIRDLIVAAARRRTAPGLLLLLFGGWSPGSAPGETLRQCAACGYEAAAVATQCAHCAAALPPAPDTTEPPPPAAAPEIAASLVTAADVAVARRAADAWREAGAGWAAWYAEREAQALEALHSTNDAARAGAGHMDQRLRRLAETEIVCPVCDGGGNRKIRSRSMKGDMIVQDAPGLRCAACAGRGRLPARRLIEDLRRAQRAGAQQARAHFIGLGWTETEDAWLPPGLRPPPAAAPWAALRRAWQARCAECLGYGALGCPDCRGAGKVKCPAPTCLHGQEICAECDGAGRTRAAGAGATVTRACAACRGAGRRACPTCDGRGYISCARCAGRGATDCRACRGQGAPELCRRCSAQGWTACAACRGAGRRGDRPCEKCGGSGQALCPSCRGYGRGNGRSIF